MREVKDDPVPGRVADGGTATTGWYWKAKAGGIEGVEDRVAGGSEGRYSGGSCRVLCGEGGGAFESRGGQVLAGEVGMEVESEREVACRCEEVMSEGQRREDGGKEAVESIPSPIKRIRSVGEKGMMGL